MAIEDESVKTKAVFTLAILSLNVVLASFVNDIWFYIVVMGAATCPFLAYVVPATIYIDIKGKQQARIALVFKLFGFAMMLTYTAISLFGWHTRRFIKVPPL
jgi:hypothetical protein